MAKRKQSLFVSHKPQSKNVTFKVSDELKERLDAINPALESLGVESKFDHAEHLRGFLEEIVTDAEEAIEQLKNTPNKGEEQASSDTPEPTIEQFSGNPQENFG